MSEPNYYMIIPAPVWNDKRLSEKDIILFGHISTLTKKDGFCYASNRYFERVMNCSVSTVKRMLKSLEDCGYITREVHYHEGSKEIENRYIYVNLGRSTGEPTPIVTGEPTPSVTSEPDNSIKNNSIKNNNISIEWKDFNKWLGELMKTYPKRGRPNIIWNAVNDFIKERKDWSPNQINDLRNKITEHLHWYLDPVYQDQTFVVFLHNYFAAEKWLEQKPKLKSDKISNKQTQGNNPAWDKFR